MDDVELLDLAAKAYASQDIKKLNFGAWFNGARGAYWNPLADDGDAFRLETEMSFTVVFWAKGVEVGEFEFVKKELRAVIGKSAYETYSCHGGDKNAARRKAATRAAAKIGRANINPLTPGDAK